MSGEAHRIEEEMSDTVKIPRPGKRQGGKGGNARKLARRSRKASSPGSCKRLLGVRKTRTKAVRHTDVGAWGVWCREFRVISRGRYA